MGETQAQSVLWDAMLRVPASSLPVYSQKVLWAVYRKYLGLLLCFVSLGGFYCTGSFGGGQ